MATAVIVFSFPNPEDPIPLGILIQKAKSVFVDKPDVRVHMAVNDSAEKIMAILEPEV